MRNGSIYYIDQGPREAMPVVLIHGFPLNHTMWAPQIAALPDKHRVIAYDIRGHGESNVGGGQYTMDIFADDLIALLNHLKIEKAVLCGLSMGGYIALRALERHPERVSALVLCDTRSEADSDETKGKRFSAVESIKEKGVPLFAEGFIKSAFAPETFINHPGVVQNVRGMILKNSSLGICSSLLAMAFRTDTTASLSQITIPTLIMVGENDQLTPPLASLSMQEKIPHARMYVIPGAGHLSNLENPTAFNQKLLSFLSEVE